MSMSAGIFFRGEVPDTAALTQAMLELGFPISVIPPHYPLLGHCGYVPMLLRGEKSGAEFYLEKQGRDTIEKVFSESSMLPKLDPSFDRCAYFVSGIRWDEAICGVCAAAAMTKLTNGIFWEDQESQVLSVEEAINSAREILEMPEPTD